MSDALKKAVDLLAYREHSCQELFNKLLRRGFVLDEVEAAIERLQCEGLLSDERYAEHYVRYRASAGFGPLRILNELKQRGVSESLIDQVIWHSDIDWSAHCFAAWQKKYNKHERLGSKAFIAQSRFLMQRGYTQDTINGVLKV